MKFVTATSAIFALLATASSVQATQDSGSPTVQKRAQNSAGVTCYYSCPEIEGNAFSSRYVFGDPYDYTGCYYANGFCFYDTAGGYYRGYGGGMPEGACPEQAPDGGCGGDQTSREFKKRNKYSLGRARDDKAIVDRQFKYPSKRSKVNRSRR